MIGIILSILAIAQEHPHLKNHRSLQYTTPSASHSRVPPLLQTTMLPADLYRKGLIKTFNNERTQLLHTKNALHFVKPKLKTGKKKNFRHISCLIKDAFINANTKSTNALKQGIKEIRLCKEYLKDLIQRHGKKKKINQVTKKTRWDGRVPHKTLPKRLQRIAAIICNSLNR